MKLFVSCKYLIHFFYVFALFLMTMQECHAKANEYEFLFAFFYVIDNIQYASEHEMTKLHG